MPPKPILMVEVPEALGGVSWKGGIMGPLSPHGRRNVATLPVQRREYLHPLGVLAWGWRDPQGLRDFPESFWKAWMQRA